MTSEAIVTGYNNFYEFGVDKGDPFLYAREMSVDPWSVEVEGECAKPGPGSAVWWGCSRSRI